MNIFIAKLNPRTTSESLEGVFSQYGEVASAKVIMDRETNRSKCFGFVEMPDDNEAWDAINALNENEFEGSEIVVKKARPREENSNNRFDNRPRRPRFNRDQY